MKFTLTLEFDTLGEVELASAAVRKAFEKAGLSTDGDTYQLVQPTPGLQVTPGKPAPAPAAASGKATVAAGAAPGMTAAALNPAVVNAVSAPQPSTAAPDKVSYPDLQKAVTALYTLDKKATLAIAAEMGVANFKALGEDQWASALAKVNAKIEELKS